MATISVSLPSDGQTIDAADYNVPINTIVSEINGGLDSDNIEAGGVVPNSLASGAGTSWAWQSWTPTLTNITNVNGTLACKYIQIGKTVFFKFKFTLGSSSAMGTDPQFSLPVTAAALDAATFIGQAMFTDTGTDKYVGAVYLNATTTAKFWAHAADTTWVRTSASPPSSTIPYTWASTDIISAQGYYEAA
jgi:hypothetical protein